MIKYFANNNSLVVLLIPIIVGLHITLDYYFPWFDHLAIGQENLWTIDFYIIDDLLSRGLAFLLICANAILLNFIFNNLSFYDKFIYLPSILYILVLFLFPISLRFGEDLIGHSFFILAFYQLLSMHQNEDARNNVFLGGLFLGSAATFLPIYTAFLLVIWFGLFTIRPFNLREYVLPLVGFIFPFLWVSLINPNFLEGLFSFSSYLGHTEISDFLIYTAYLIVVVLTLLANKKILERRMKSSIRYKRIISITIMALLFALILSTLVLFFYNTYFYFTVPLAILPFILPYAFLDIKHTWLPNTLFYLLVLLNILKFFY